MKTVLFSLITLLVLTGCSNEMILKVGEQIDEETVEFKDEITDIEKIEKVKEVLNQMKETNIKDFPKNYPDTVLLIENKKDNYSELNVSIWFNGKNAIISKGMFDYKEKQFYKLDSSQTKKLKTILNN